MIWNGLTTDEQMMVRDWPGRTRQNGPVVELLKRVWFDLHWQVRDCQVKLATLDALAYIISHLLQCDSKFSPHFIYVKIHLVAQFYQPVAQFYHLVAQFYEEFEYDLNIVRTIPFQTASVSFSPSHLAALDWDFVDATAREVLTMRRGVGRRRVQSGDKRLFDEKLRFLRRTITAAVVQRISLCDDLRIVYRCNT